MPIKYLSAKKAAAHNFLFLYILFSHSSFLLVWYSETKAFHFSSKTLGEQASYMNDLNSSIYDLRRCLSIAFSICQEQIR
uniref:Uncharacterized protein n=1 Tax=Arundo donax TaxID=35708 RepID=A0A0A9DU48_ARUDO